MWSLLHKSSIFFALVGGVLITALSSCFPFPGSSDGTQPRTLTTRTPVSNVIQQENALPGTSDWKISPAKEASIEIQAYASATSVSPGQTLTFFVSTQNE